MIGTEMENMTRRIVLWTTIWQIVEHQEHPLIGESGCYSQL